jgi:hypothetical protein
MMQGMKRPLEIPAPYVQQAIKKYSRNIIQRVGREKAAEQNKSYNIPVQVHVQVLGIHMEHDNIIIKGSYTTYHFDGIAV